MPVEDCQRNGKDGKRWGTKGYCYTYTKGDKESEKRAEEKAKRQGRAEKANQNK